MNITRLTLTVAACALMAACQKQEPAPVGPPPSPVRTTKPTVSDVAVYRDYPGMTMSVRNVDVIPRVDGWINSQGFVNGQEVNEGEVLYIIDPRPFQVAVEKAKADIAIVEADLKNAHDKVERNRPLVEVGAISQEAFDQMLANMRSADANLDAKHAMLDDANLSLSFTRIVSPVSGKTSATNIYAGTYVTPKDLLVSVRQVDPLWVEFEPVESDIPALRKLQQSGDSSTVAHLPGSEWQRSGKVVFIDNTVNRQTSTIRTRIEIPNKDRTMAPGAYLNVRMQVDELKNAISIPEKAIVYQTAAATVWIADAEGKARQKVVQTGPRGGAGIVITGGLGSEEILVIEGMQKLRDGAQTIAPEVLEQAMKAQIDEKMGKAGK